MVIVLLEYIDLFLRLAVLQVRIFSIYTENNYTYYAGIMLDAFRYLLC